MSREQQMTTTFVFDRCRLDTVPVQGSLVVLPGNEIDPVNIEGTSNSDEQNLTGHVPSGTQISTRDVCQVHLAFIQ